MKSLIYFVQFSVKIENKQKRTTNKKHIRTSIAKGIKLTLDCVCVPSVALFDIFSNNKQILKMDNQTQKEVNNINIVNLRIQYYVLLSFAFLLLVTQLSYAFQAIHEKKVSFCWDYTRLLEALFFAFFHMFNI